MSEFTPFHRVERRRDAVCLRPSGVGSDQRSVITIAATEAAQALASMTRLPRARRESTSAHINGTYFAQSLGTDHIAEHASFAHSSDFAEPVRTASAPWLVVHWQDSSSEDPPPVNDAQSCTLFRCRRRGPCEPVMHAFTVFGTGESWSVAETPSGDLRVTSSLGGRTQVLRWDAAAWRLTL